jgi:hypothetical protein
MTEQEEKQTSVEYLLDIINNLLGDNPYDILIFNEITVAAKEKYEKELNSVFSMGKKYGNELKKNKPNPF